MHPAMEVVRFHCCLTCGSHHALTELQLKQCNATVVVMTLRAASPAMGHAASQETGHNSSPYSPWFGHGRDSQDEIDEDDDDDEEYDRDNEVRTAPGEDASDVFPWLDVSALLQAMGKCNEAYNQSDRGEFYAMVAEEYASILHEDIPIEVIERNDTALRRFALAILNGSPASEDLLVPPDVKKHGRDLIAFYKMRAEVSVARPHGEDAKPHAQSPLSHPESPYGSVVSTAEHTDESTSNPATPVVEEAQPSGNGTAASTGGSALANKEGSLVVERSGTAAPGSRVLLSGPDTGSIAYRHAWEVLEEQTRERDASSERLRLAEERVKAERALVQQRKQEYKQLKELVKSYRVRDEEKKRLAAAMGEESGFDSDGGDDHRLRKDRKALRKETKRLRKLQETLSLEFKVLKTKAKCKEMKIEQELAELKRAYVDSCLFTEVELPISGP